MTDFSDSPGYWAVYPNFLQPGKFTVEQRDAAILWCRENCVDKFISSDLHPWAFLNEQDALNFQKQFGDIVQYKPEERI